MHIRELATVLFILGQLGVTKDMLPEGVLSNVMTIIAGEEQNHH